MVKITAKVQHTMNHYPVQFVFKSGAEFFCIASYRFNRNKNFSLYGSIFFVVMKRNDISKKIMLQKFFIDAEQIFIFAEYNVQLFQFFFLFPESSQHPAFYCGCILNSEIRKLIG